MYAHEVDVLHLVGRKQCEDAHDKAQNTPGTGSKPMFPEEGKAQSGRPEGTSNK